MFFAFLTPKANIKAWHDKDLHVFNPDEANLNKSMDHFFELYAMRNRTNREFWLLDITLFQSVENACERFLKYMPNLDLDDDFFVFANNKSDFFMINVWEYFEIDPSIPRQLLHYGTWSQMQRMVFSGRSKWIRRRNLQVMNDLCKGFHVDDTSNS